MPLLRFGQPCRQIHRPVWATVFEHGSHPFLREVAHNTAIDRSKRWREIFSRVGVNSSPVHRKHLHNKDLRRSNGPSSKNNPEN
jgi:hypothetical protein